MCNNSGLKTFPTHARAHVRRDVTCYGKTYIGNSRHAGICDSHMRAHAHAYKDRLSPRHRTTLPKLLGIGALRDYQEQGIAASIAGRDVLVIAPTGSGKSEIFFGAGLARGGLNLVISPLRSLIADQYRRLQALDLPVRIWNSDVSDDYKAETIRLIRYGWRGFLITTPESLKGEQLSRELVGRVDLAVIDEAHCVLRERGFRICYGWLGRTIQKLEPRALFACTATLSGRDCETLVRTLNMTDPVRIILPVTRSNLCIEIVERGPDTLASILNCHRGKAGIVFCATVQTACKQYAKLTVQGRKNIILYHGRLTVTAKQEAQAAFMADNCVAITTDAFLLGIDKADLRFVVHYDHPKSIEDWVQGFGRAGRDGLPAFVYGCFVGSTEGKKSRQFLINATFPPVNDLREVWEFLLSAPFRDETQVEIGEHVLGPRGRYSCGAIITALLRHQLADAKPHPDDARRKLYRGIGDFDRVDWGPYQDEYRETCRRFDQLSELATLPDAEIPAAIDEYFGVRSDADKPVEAA